MSTTKRRMSYEFILKRGTGGSTATTVVENCRDTAYVTEVEYVESTPRQTDGSYPITYEDAVASKPGISWSMDRKDGDASLAALLAAARASPPTIISLKTESISGGTGVDGDFTLQVNEEAPEKGKQGYTFEAHPSDGCGRQVSLNAT